jgi:MGT family glycosyltransferase
MGEPRTLKADRPRASAAKPGAAASPGLVLRRSVVFFCMPESGHFQRLRSLIAGVVRMGYTAEVFTHRKFRSGVESAGGRFVDLFSRYPLEQADNASLPVPSRYVTFAGKYAEPIRRDVEKSRPLLVIHDTFAVIGQVVSALLGVPRVNVCAGHNVAPDRFLQILKEDPRVKISPACLEAVHVLKESYGLVDASPFSYISSLSSELNIYCEPPEFLDENERNVFEPLAFYGSLPSPNGALEGCKNHRPWLAKRGGSQPTIYVSFGTVVWRYWERLAVHSLKVLAESFARMGNLRVVMSLGGAHIDGRSLTGIEGSNIIVQRYVDQWEMLRKADVFVTHHGLNSSHEAIYCRVPMISYPFFWDQPSLANKCQQFGLAFPLAQSPRGSFCEDDVIQLFSKLSDKREALQAALSRAREWEVSVIDGRPAVLRRLVSLAA